MYFLQGNVRRARPTKVICMTVSDRHRLADGCVLWIAQRHGLSYSFSERIDRTGRRQRDPQGISKPVGE